MTWQGIPEFVAMGGHGPYVWGSFGAVALLLAIEMVALRLRRRALLRSAAAGGGQP